MDYQLAIFIGRFQPAHKSHIQAIRQALDIADKLLIIIGSSHSAPNIKNPFTYEQRIDIIKNSLNSEEIKRIVFAPVRDYFYNELNWVTEIQNAVSQNSEKNDAIALIGHYKDSSSYYLNLFPQYDFFPIKNTEVLNSTDVRKNLFDPKDLQEINKWQDKGTSMTFAGSFDSNIENMLAPGAFQWIMDHFILTEKHISLIKEYQFIKKYKQIWEQAPFPPTFVTSDAVVIKSGHILVIKRKFEPGKGLYALPGGFIKQNETIEQSAIRELKEETKIDVNKNILYSSIKDKKVFDHPERSLRGRTLTHAFCINLGQGELPEIKASDDAFGAQWLSILDIGKLEDQFFEDHFHIINYFINR